MPSDIRIRLILDPQEYDYLIPNEGTVGFRLAVVSGDENELPDYVITGPMYHTYVDVKVGFCVSFITIWDKSALFVTL